MKKSLFPFVLGLCAVGMFSGYAARRLSVPRPAAASVPKAPAVPVRTDRPNGGIPGNNDAAPAAKSPAAGIPHVRSSDTLETLAAIKDGTLYSRLAAWMIDATEEDISAYWSSYQKGERSNDITDLVFINWTRLNPQGAIAAVAGGKDEHYAWWAWAAHDPKAALAAAIATNPDRVNNVAWGIGEFDPQWMRDHFDQIPEAARGNAMQGFAKWNDGANPLEALEFMKKHEMGFDRGTFKALVNQDPWAAFDWIKENPSLQNDFHGSGGAPMDILLATMGREHPDDLERLAAQTPSGTLKRKMEATLFDNLLAVDPAAALEKAKATDVPLTGVERLAKVGQSFVKSDPDKAFEIAGAIFASSPGTLESETRIDYPRGSTWWGSPDGPATELVTTLLGKEPARVLDLFHLGENGRINNSQIFNRLSHQWAQQDLVGFTNWVNAQTQPEIHDSAADTVINQLVELKQFPEAMEWSTSSDRMRNRGGIHTAFYHWKEFDPAAAAEWLDAADLPENEKARFEATLNRQPKNTGK